jgi:hypothetical protein
MKNKVWPDFIVITAIVLLVDWILGVLGAFGPIFKWIFLIFNIPFGAIYVWMESSWEGTHYLMLGHRVGDFGSLFIFLFVVLAQSCVYFAVYEWIKKRRMKKGESK